MTAMIAATIVASSTVAMIRQWLAVLASQTTKVRCSSAKSVSTEAGPLSE